MSSLYIAQTKAKYGIIEIDFLIYSSFKLIIYTKFQKELYRRLGNAIVKRVIDERDKADKDLQHIRNENFRRKLNLID